MVAEGVKDKTGESILLTGPSLAVSRLTLQTSCSFVEAFFDAIWPLSRFVGYRPPTFPDYDSSRHSQLIYQLPTRYHRKHIEFLKRQAEERNRRGEEGDPGRESGEHLVDKETKQAEKEKQERDEKKSKWEKFGDKAFHMLVTYIASFAAIAFLALCTYHF
jgi:hypothetical protein